jgi:phospholipid/cholesterol/gamma-HCH transport system substrate-binding protein
VVDLDALLNAVDPAVRRDIQGIVRDAAVALTPRTAEQTNAGLEMLNPALSRLTALGRELTTDEAALRSLLPRAATLARVVAERREALGRGLDAGADVFTALAAERDTLAAMLGRAPATMRRTRETLSRVRTQTLPVVDPLLRASRPAIGPLADVIREVEPTLRGAEPLIARLRELIPASRAALEPLPGIADAAVPAVAAITKGMADALPMITGLRPYTPELVAGFFTGFGGSTAHSYDANGHYGRIYLTGTSGSFSGLTDKAPDASSGYRTRLDARCPGGAEEPHPDGSNPWPEGANADGRNACDPEHDR